MIYFWDLERGLAKLIEELKGQDLKQSLFQINKPYEGEFQLPAHLPEDYQPFKSYCLVQFDQEQPQPGQTASPLMQNVSGNVIVFLGVHRRNMDQVKEEVYRAVPLVKRQLHGKRIQLGNNPTQIELRWGGIGTEFAIPGHLCLRSTINYKYFDDGTTG